MYLPVSPNKNACIIGYFLYVEVVKEDFREMNVFSHNFSRHVKCKPSRPNQLYADERQDVLKAETA
ncbi:hypothetical protein [Metabacillus sp. 84]|uniref:hypothetical protein n=1 Tax=Metabacillus sp. 84 TaxID=3404705 RepID=UPI003CF7C518